MLDDHIGRFDVNDLDVAARPQVVESFGVHVVPVSEGAGHAAEMDQVELLVPYPLLLGIVDLKLEVLRDGVWLDGTQVAADDPSVGELPLVRLADNASRERGSMDPSTHSANSIAQSPVPVPTSNTARSRSGFRGATNSCPRARVRKN